jgi:molybdopterin converting factor small subunit
MKGTIRRLNNQGDTAIEFDTELGVTEEAEEILGTAARSRSALFDGTTRERIGDTASTKTILEEHEEILIVPPMAGGA